MLTAKLKILLPSVFFFVKCEKNDNDLEGKSDIKKGKEDRTEVGTRSFVHEVTLCSYLQNMNRKCIYSKTLNITTV